MRRTGWRFDPAGLEALLRPDTKLVVWNFPHNPTGALPSAGGLRPDGRRRRPGGSLAVLRRDVPAPGAGARAAPSRGGRPLRTGRLAGRDVQGLRAGRAAHRLGGHPRSGPPGADQEPQGLHDHLQQRARASCWRSMALRQRESILAANVARDRAEPAGGRAPSSTAAGISSTGCRRRPGTVCFSAACRGSRDTTPDRRRPRAAARLLRAAARADRRAPAAVDRLRLRRFALPAGPGQGGLQRGARGAGRLPARGERLRADASRHLGERRGEFRGSPRRPRKGRRGIRNRAPWRCPRRARTLRRRSGADCADSPCSPSCPRRGSRSPAGSCPCRWRRGCTRTRPADSCRWW